MREDEVNKAVQFLKHPSLQQQPQQQQQQQQEEDVGGGGGGADAAADFLRSKGLTEEELLEALRRAKRPTNEPSPPSSHLRQQPPAPVAAADSPRGAFGWALRALVGVGALAALREFLRRYVAPLYFPELRDPAPPQRRQAAGGAPAARPASADLGALRKEVRHVRESLERLRDERKGERDALAKLDEVSASLRSLGDHVHALGEMSRLRDDLRAEMTHAVSRATSAREHHTDERRLERRLGRLERHVYGREEEEEKEEEEGEEARLGERHQTGTTTPPSWPHQAPATATATASAQRLDGAGAAPDLPDFGDIQPADVDTWAAGRTGTDETDKS